MCTYLGAEKAVLAGGAELVGGVVGVGAYLLDDAPALADLAGGAELVGGGGGGAYVGGGGGAELVGGGGGGGAHLADDGAPLLGCELKNSK